MIKKILVLVLLIVFSNASNCDTRLFTYENSLDKTKHLKISEFLDLLATQKCGINIVYKDNIAKEILNEKMPYVKIKNYTLRQILDLILTKKGIFYTLKGDTLSLSYFKTKTFKIDFISSTRTGESNLDATDSKVKNTYNFNFWSKIETQINDLTKSTFLLDPNYEMIKDIKTSNPIVEPNTGVIVVTGTMKQLNAVSNYINNLVKNLTKEVLIDVHVYSVELSSSHKTGIDWSQLSINLNKTNVPLMAKYIGGSEAVFNSATFNINGLLNFLSQNGNVNSISNPKIMTLNNQKAIISVGDTINYSYTVKPGYVDKDGNYIPPEYELGTKFVGIVLDITPQISDNGDIILSIEPKISSFRDIGQLTDTTRNLPPDTKDNTMLSIVKIKNNQTLVLGGLITNDKTLKVNGVPVLKEIPIIKYLFSSKEKVTSKKELVFVITPHIIDFKHKKTLRDLGFGKF